MGGRGWFVKVRETHLRYLPSRWNLCAFVWKLQNEVSLSEEQRLICRFASILNRNTIKAAVEKTELKPSCKKALIISCNYLWYEYSEIHRIFALKKKKATSLLPSPRFSHILFSVPFKDCRAHSSKSDNDVPAKLSAVFGKMEWQTNLSVIT